MRILIIEDSSMVADWIAMILREAGYDTTVASTVADGTRIASSLEFDLAIVDLDLPDGTGLSIVHALRAAGRRLPILIMTGREDDTAVIAGLDAGADDYLIKPVANGVLRARVRAALRRGGATQLDTVTIGALSMNRVQRVVTSGEAKLDLSPKEYALLEYFMMRPDHVVSRSDLLEQIWGMRFDPYTNVVDTTVSRLRRKLEVRTSTPMLRTVRGTGFVLSL